MNKRIFLFAIIFLSTFGCARIDKLTQFEMEYTESVTIESMIGINLPFNLFTPAISTNSESVFEINDTRKDRIEQIILTSLDLTLSIPDDGDFSFLKAIEIYISADGLDELKIAWKEDIPSTVADYIELDTADEDLQEYIVKDEFSLRVNTITDKLISSNHQIDIHSIFFVDAEVLGQ